MPQRVEAEEVRERIKGDDGALLVCADDDMKKSRDAEVEGSIPYPEFNTRFDSIPKSKEIIFFCA